MILWSLEGAAKVGSDVPKISAAVTSISERLHDELALGDLLGLERVPREHCSALVLPPARWALGQPCKHVDRPSPCQLAQVCGHSSFLPPRWLGQLQVEAHDNCDHNCSGQRQKLNWIRFVLPHYLMTFATRLQYFCNFILHFCNTFHLHWGSTELLWSKKRYITNTGPIGKWSFFVTFFVTDVGSQLTFQMFRFFHILFSC